MSDWVFVRAVALCALVFSVTAPAEARDVVTLGELLPALQGTELSDIPVSDAPPAGSSRKVRRREMRRALRRAGVDPASVSLPDAVLVSRVARNLTEEQVLALVEGPVMDALSPCKVEDIHTQGRTRVGSGELSVLIARRPQLRTGRLTMMVTLASAGREARVPVTARVSCPPPAVTSGAAVQIVVRIGAVRASTMGVALQSGRVGDLVRVRNAETNATLSARVVDAQRVEVMR